MKARGPEIQSLQVDTSGPKKAPVIVQRQATVKPAAHAAPRTAPTVHPTAREVESAAHAAEHAAQAVRNSAYAVQPAAEAARHAAHAVRLAAQVAPKAAQTAPRVPPPLNRVVEDPQIRTPQKAPSEISVNQKRLALRYHLPDDIFLEGMQAADLWSRYPPGTPRKRAMRDSILENRRLEPHVSNLVLLMEGILAQATINGLSEGGPLQNINVTPSRADPNRLSHVAVQGISPNVTSRQNVEREIPGPEMEREFSGPPQDRTFPGQEQERRFSGPEQEREIPGPTLGESYHANMVDTDQLIGSPPRSGTDLGRSRMPGVDIRQQPGVYHQQMGVQHPPTGDYHRNFAHDSYGIKRKECRVHPYDGKENFDSYMSYFESIASGNDWDESYKLLKLYELISGGTVREVARSIDLRSETYHTLVDKLRKEFSTDADRLNAKRQFHSRARDVSKESPREYWAILARLASRAYPDWPASTIEQEITERFVLGHPDTARATLAVIGKPSKEDLIRIAGHCIPAKLEETPRDRGTRPVRRIGIESDTSTVSSETDGDEDTTLLVNLLNRARERQNPKPKRGKPPIVSSPAGMTPAERAKLAEEIVNLLQQRTQNAPVAALDESENVSQEQLAYELDELMQQVAEVEAKAPVQRPPFQRYPRGGFAGGGRGRGQSGPPFVRPMNVQSKCAWCFKPGHFWARCAEMQKHVFARFKEHNAAAAAKTSPEVVKPTTKEVDPKISNLQRETEIMMQYWEGGEVYHPEEEPDIPSGNFTGVE